jgi:hypothetical protein
MMVDGSLISLSPGGLRKTVDSPALPGRVIVPNRERVATSFTKRNGFTFKPAAQRLFK